MQCWQYSQYDKITNELHFKTGLNVYYSAQEDVATYVNALYSIK